MDQRRPRKVALKFLPPAVAQDARARARLEREAQAASALDHPNIATVYEIGEWQDQPFIAMAYYDGETLKQRLDRGPLPLADVVSIGAHVAAGLAAAHAAGIVHRDLKPANVMLTRDGQVRIVDFGIAKVVSDATATAMRLTQVASIVGTAAYMSPEQASGEEVDEGADVWALGVVLYEMLAGRLPFQAGNTDAMLSSVRSDPPPVRRERPDVPPELERVIGRALEKDRGSRTIRAADIASELSTYGTGIASVVRAGPPPSLASLAREPRVLIPIALVVILLAGWLAWSAYRGAQEREARRALSDIERLADQERFLEAFLLARRVERHVPDDAMLARLWSIVTRPTTVLTDPPGADVYFHEYAAPPDTWIHLGRSPLENVPAPRGFLRWKVEKAGFVAAYGTQNPRAPSPVRLQFRLFAATDVPENMVYVEPPNEPYSLVIPGLEHLPPVALQGSWIDRYEVTNRDFKRFIDSGGYERPEFWTHRFVGNGREFGWEDAMARFRDATGRAGPATWELGSYPEGQADYPVTGVSWYEAAAYAEFAGKALPTIYDWNLAAGPRTSAVVVPASNFSRVAAAPVGRYRGMNAHGTSDMAGNVKEWVWNLAAPDKRYILGGAWDEPPYMFNVADARDPMQRGLTFGCRCVKYAAPDPAPATAGMIAVESRDYATERPVGDEVFRAYRRLYAYDRTDLASTVDSVDDTHQDWRRETVGFAAAYGGERVIAYLYLARRRDPPYQTVIYFPGSNTLRSRSSDVMGGACSTS